MFHNNNMDQQRRVYNFRPRKNKKSEEEKESSNQTPTKKPEKNISPKQQIETIEKVNKVIDSLTNNIVDDVLEKVSGIIYHSKPKYVEVDVEVDESENDDEHTNTNFVEDADSESEDDYILVKKTRIDGNKWKHGLSEKEIKENKHIFENIQKEKLTLSKILNAKLTEKEKTRAVKIFAYLKRNTFEYQELIQLIQSR